MKTENSAENFLKIVKLDSDKWNQVPSDSEITETVKALEGNGIKVVVVENAAQALEEIGRIIPPDSEIMNGSSTTLEEIGFIDFLKIGKHNWKNFHEAILAETDKAKKADLRRKSVTAEYFLASPNAITKNGEIIAVDESGSRTGALLYAAKNLILVSGMNKITENFESGMQRIREYVFPLENERAKKVYEVGSRIAKMAVFFFEGRKGRTTLILVKEKLGY